MATAHALVSKVVDMLTSAMEQDFRLLVDVEEAQSIAFNFRLIREELFSAERRLLKEASVREWLDVVKSVAYDVDDVLDEWRYEILKSQFAKRRVWTLSLSSACNFFPCIVSPHHIAVKISNLNSRLHAIPSLRRDVEYIEYNITTPDMDVSKVQGRDIEKEKVLNLLLADSSDRMHPICFVGMAGIGKTTLAKLVYNDKMVKTHFEERIWVCVSEPFDKNRILEAILESCLHHTYNYTPILAASRSTEMKIQEFIYAIKFLLVLDDVWNEDLDKWMQLKDCLMCGFPGSKILVTTRKENVAKLMGCMDEDIVQVGLLSKMDCWSMFCDIAVICQSSEQRKKLETTGIGIVARCKGLPLAVKTMAGLLHFKFLKQEWEYVLGSELWNLEKAKQDIFGPLSLSYYDLSPSLRQCFLYCAAFPKNYRISKDGLISLWMAHGFLKPTENRDMEMIGHDYFCSLGMRFLFQDFEVEEKFNKLDKTYFNMHDIVHDFSKYMMGRECLCIDVNSIEDAASSVDVEHSDYTYHLCLKIGEKGKFFDSLYSLRKLRSLIIVPSKTESLVGAALPRIFDRLTCLRSLCLSHCGLESIPSNINKLIHLRWLKVSKNYALKGLPGTICQLYNLQTLSVNWCVRIVHFPEGVEKLINLRHLNNDYTYFSLPKVMGKLCGLRKLLRITIDPEIKDSFSLRDLKNLNNITGSFTIFFVERRHNTLVKDAKQANLHEKKHISALILNLPERAAEEWMPKEDEKLLEALKPPPSLKMLRITSFVGENCPSWINTLTSLKKLKLWYWRNCKCLPTLAKLPCLEHIEFSNFGSVEKVGAEFYRMDGPTIASSSTTPLFPKLKHLQFMNMTEWKEWSDYDGIEEVMPNLSNLSIENCPKLKELPAFVRKKETLQKAHFTIFCSRHASFFSP